MPEPFNVPEEFDKIAQLINDRCDSIDARLDAIERSQNTIVSEFASLRKDNRRVEEMVHVFVEEVIALKRLINRGETAA